MSKLFNIETDSKKKDDLIKGLFFTIALVAIVIGALINYHAEKKEYPEDASEPKLCVHVKGAVRESGLYYVPFGTRVTDLGEYAGGFLPDADFDGVNLAEYVKDGTEVYIPFKGSFETGGYDLNAVTFDELVKNIDGIGETYAKKIIAYRDSHGEFKLVSELKAIVGENVYEKVREKFYITE